jgi:hypothetical protein
LYINRPDPIAFLPPVVDTTGRLHDDFSPLLFLHTHREVSTLTNEIPEESGQFLFLRATFYANIKGSVGLILVDQIPRGNSPDKILTSRWTYKEGKKMGKVIIVSLCPDRIFQSTVRMRSVIG